MGSGKLAGFLNHLPATTASLPLIENRRKTRPKMQYKSNTPKRLVYGPVQSRRVGMDLGINPLHSSYKWCPFDCPYCQDGLSKYSSFGHPHDYPLPTADEIVLAVEEKLRQLNEQRAALDSISFCGNGEPTLHPQFLTLVDEVMKLRDRFFPKARVGAFSTGTTLQNRSVFDALMKLDARYMKLDAGTEKIFRFINCPPEGISLHQVVDDLELLSKCVPITIQTMFVQGPFNNITSHEIAKWIETLIKIHPVEVHIYSLDRKPRDRTVTKVCRHELEEIAQLARSRYNLPVLTF